MHLHITSKNTLAFGEKGVQFSLPTKGLTLVKGVHLSSTGKTSNGTGKSSLLSVVLWGIFGTIPKGRTKSDIKNDVAEKDCITDITIENNGKTGRIIRTISADEYEVNGVVPIVGDTLAFFIDEEDCRGHSDKETQINITNFIGLDEESFMASAWFAADSESFASKTPSKQDVLFIKLLRLQNLESALKITKEMRDTVIDDLTEVDKKISIIDSNLVEIENTKESLENSVKRWKQEKTDKLERFDNKIRNAKELIKNSEFDLAESADKLAELQKRLNNHNSPDGLPEEFEKEIKVFESKISEYNIELGKIRGLISNDNRLLKSAQNLSGGTKCTKCGSELTEEHLYTYRDELNELLESNEVKEEKIEKSIHGIREKLSRVKEKLASLVSAKNDFRELQSKIRRYNDRKQSLEVSVRNQNENLGELKKDKAELEQTIPPQSQETSQLIERIETLTKQKDHTKNERDSLLIEKERSDFWIRGFGPQGIRNLLIRSAIPTLNKHAQEFSKILTGGELTVRFSGEKEVGKGKNTEKRNKMNVSAIDITGSNKYSKASGGEKRRIDMCCDLALHFLVSENTNLPFLFIDELFTQLDNRGKELVMVLLRKLTERIEGIVVISNMDDIASEEFDSVWTVYRRGQQSWLEKE